MAVASFEHAAAQVAAVWRMARGRADWADRLATSPGDAALSFSALIYATPFFIIGFDGAFRLANASPKAPLQLAELGSRNFIVIQLVARVAEWLVGAGALTAFARGMGIGERTPTIVTSYNWAQFMNAAAFSIVLFMATFMQLTTGSMASAILVVGLFAFPALAIQFLLIWGVLRRGFERSVADTITLFAALVAANLAVAAFVGAFVSAFLDG
ncbi:MAG: hypothetical protein ACFB00_11955 [Parvularculaceae bacterium]